MGNDDKTNKSVSRRDFVRTAGAAATVAPQAGAKDKTSSGHDYDVIGGGFAGATAAREAANAGLRTIVLEARNRLGGRTFFSKFAGHEIELGGAWIHWAQPHVWSEVNDYRLDPKEEPGTAAPESMVFVSGGKPITVDADEMWEEMEKACADFCAPGRATYPRPFDPCFAKDEVEKYDALSIADRLGQLDLSPAMRDIMNGFWSTCTHWSLNPSAINGRWTRIRREPGVCCVPPRPASTLPACNRPKATCIFVAAASQTAGAVL